jgi:hypothetical protein
VLIFAEKQVNLILFDSVHNQGKRILPMNALIPQPLLPKWEKGSKILRIKVPLPAWERDLG